MALSKQSLRFLTKNSLAILMLLVVACTIPACSGSGDTDDETVEDTTNLTHDPYMMMHETFVGNPEKPEIKGLLEEVLIKYKVPQTDSVRIREGNMLLMLRQTSKANITEMSILKHIYQHGTTNIALDKQAIISATQLEQGAN